MNRKGHIAADPAVLAGKPVVKGTRLSVEFILDLFTEGWDEQRVLDNYPQLTAADLQALVLRRVLCRRQDNPQSNL